MCLSEFSLVYFAPGVTLILQVLDNLKETDCGIGYLIPPHVLHKFYPGAVGSYPVNRKPSHQIMETDTKPAVNFADYTAGFTFIPGKINAFPVFESGFRGG
jgi:hypothetical protein